jgi:hypothetical protein
MGRRFAFNKTVEEYRRLAKECRETAHTVSRENERSGLLAMAQQWQLIAGRNADPAEVASENGRRASKARAAMCALEGLPLQGVYAASAGGHVAAVRTSLGAPACGELSLFTKPLFGGHLTYQCAPLLVES